jgi:hypothetical protein
MKVKNLTIIYVILTIIIGFPGLTAQTGCLKSKRGFVLFYSSDSLNFTIRLDEPNTEVPIWINNNYLQLFKDYFHLQVINQNQLPENVKSISNNLSMLQKWETDYIKSAMQASVKRSAFYSDNDSINHLLLGVESNAWFYSVDVNLRKIYFYYYDVYRSGHFVRLTFIGRIQSARLFIPAVLKGIHFYSKKIQVEKLQNALKQNQYEYVE